MKIDASTYQDASREHVNLARELYENEHYAAATYFAGLSVECVLRAATVGQAFDSRHDLMALLRESQFLVGLPETQAQRITAAAGVLWARWRNTHRYFSAARFKRYLVVHGLHHRLKGDPVKENARIAVSSALTIVGRGAYPWIR